MDVLSSPYTSLLLISALLISFLLLFVYWRIRPYQKLQKNLKLIGVKGQQIAVGYLSVEDLAGGRIHKRYSKPAMLVLDDRGYLHVYILSDGESGVKYRLPVTDTNIAWFRSSLGGMLPPLLCLRFDGRSHYLYKRNRVTGSPTRTAGKLYAELVSMFPALPSAQQDKFTYVEWGMRFYALFVFAVVLVAIVASWAPGTDEEPMVLSQQNNGFVLAASNRWLYRFDGDDQLQERIDLTSLGIQQGISDMEPMQDDRFLVGDSAAGVIKLCDFSAKLCETLTGFNGKKLLLRSFQFVSDIERQRIYVADSSRHRLLELNAEGKLLREIAGADRLCFPNDPQIIKDQLVIANTNHHSLLAWDLSQPEFSEPTGEWLTVQTGRDDVHCPGISEIANTEYFAREKRHQGDSPALPFSTSRIDKIWPFEFRQGSDGAVWVLNAGNNLQHADLMIFDQWPFAAEPRRVDIAETSDPISLLLRHNDILLAETDKPSIIRISTEGKVLGQFGGHEFSELMASINKRQQTYARVALYAQYTVFGLLFVFIIVALVIKKLRLKYIQKLDPAFTFLVDKQSE